MNLVKQPPNSRLCGQACLAMIADITLERAIEVVGHSKGTTTKELIDALKKLGFRCASIKLKRGHPPLNTTCICKVTPNWREEAKGNWHWIVWTNNQYLDPADAIVHEVYRLVSYIEVVPL